MLGIKACYPEYIEVCRARSSALCFAALCFGALSFGALWLAALCLLALQAGCASKGGNPMAPASAAAWR
ncbi:MAG: hypothetical protein ACRENS_02975, partial [Candidatus Eiseniibacteriota bacterium]